MTVISYAQNYEDVMLLRAFRNVKSGFYIDVGAQDPVNDSVTKAFYERGWHGINIEPVTHWFERLCADRVHDINLQLAVSDSPGHLHLYQVENSGLSTTDPEFARRHIDAGLEVSETDVPCVTLDAICDAHDVREIHFLKVDCEGAEAAVFRGFSFQRLRPWIILVEATEPNTQRPAYSDWDPILVSHRYRFVYEDGLNRFYVAEEHAELLEAFAHPPNVFDAFVRAPEATAQLRLQDAETQLQHAQTQLALLNNAERCIRAELQNDSLNRQNAELRAALDERDTEISRLHREVALRDRLINGLQLQLQAFLGSTSWLVTAPLRGCARVIREIRRGLKSFIFNVLRLVARCARPLLRAMARWSLAKSLLRRLLGDDSRLLSRARLFLRANQAPDGIASPHGVAHVLDASMDPTAAERRMHSILNRAWSREGVSEAVGLGLKEENK